MREIRINDYDRLETAMSNCIPPCTDDVIRILRDTKDRALARHLTGDVPPVLVLWSMLCWEKRFGIAVLESCGVDLSELKTDIDRILIEAQSNDEYNLNFKKIVSVVMDASSSAVALCAKHVGTEHLLLALCESTDSDLRKVMSLHVIERTALINHISEKDGKGVHRS